MSQRSLALNPDAYDCQKTSGSIPRLLPVRILTACLIGWAMLLAFGGCGGRSGAPTLDEPLRTPSSGAVTSDWLARQPGLKIGEFSFHVLDAAANPLPFPGWLVIEQPGPQPEFSVALKDGLENDVYLYVAYDGGAYSFSTMQLTPAGERQFVALAVADRAENVVAAGFSLIAGYREAGIEAGKVATLSFARGSESGFRAISAVNQSPKSAVELTIGDSGEDWVNLEWDERNIGDYNNNGLVEISDITPIGLYFNQEVATASNPARLAIVDGNLDGLISINDLTPIGQSWGSSIHGFNIYYAPGEEPDPADFSLVEPKTVLRSTVWDALGQEERKVSLHYVFEAAATESVSNFYVRAFAEEQEVLTEGPASNIAVFNLEGNQPPLWASSVGLTAAAGIDGGLLLDFGRAIDPEGQDVSYVLRYVIGVGPIGSEAQEIVLSADATLEDPPYHVYVPGFADGTEYTVLLVAADEDGARTDNTAELTTTVAGFAYPDEVWGCHRADPARSGSNPDSVISFPLVEEFSKSILFEVNSDAMDHPVLNNEGALTVCTNNGFRVFDPLDGSENNASSGFGSLSSAMPAIFGQRMVVNTKSGLDVVNIAESETPLSIGTFGQVRCAPLLLGDCIYAADEAGIVYCFSAVTGQRIWEFSVAPSAPYHLALVADETYLYAVRDDWRMDKLDLRTGVSVAQGQHDDTIYGDSLALDMTNDVLYMRSPGSRLIALNTEYLVVEQDWPLEPGEKDTGVSPALALDHIPPLALVAITSDVSDKVRVVAIDLDDGSEYWKSDFDRRNPKSISVGSDHVYVINVPNSGGQHCISVLAIETGELLQQINIEDDYNSEVVLGDDRLAYMYEDLSDQMYLQVLVADTVSPPYWENELNGEIGIRAFQPGGATSVSTPYDIDPRWYDALHEDELPVKYALFYAAGHAPELEPPYTDTTVVPGYVRADNDSDSFITGLTPNTRYYGAIRAYVGEWGVNATTDSNTVVMSCSPPWDSRFAAISGANRPTTYGYLAAAVDSGNNKWLVISDGADGGAWLYREFGLQEEAWTTPFKLDVASASCTGTQFTMAIGKASVNTNIRFIKRTGNDSYEPAWVGGTTIDSTVAISLSAGTEHFLAYTQHVGGTAPTSDVSYYLAETSSGTWQAPAAIDGANFGGRDISVIHDPADETKAYIAYQHGTAKGSTLPLATKGELWIAHGNSGGGFSHELIDAGENTPDSDCGKRVKLDYDAAGNLHLAYLDLNAAATQPKGQLKYATNVGGSWEIEVLHTFDTSHPVGEYQHTYSDLGFDLRPDGRPVISFRERTSFASGDENPDLHDCIVFAKDGAGSWVSLVLTETDEIYRDDRSPCELIADLDDGYLYVYYLGTSTNPDLGSNDNGIRWLYCKADWPLDL